VKRNQSVICRSFCRACSRPCRQDHQALKKNLATYLTAFFSGLYSSGRPSRPRGFIEYRASSPDDPLFKSISLRGVPTSAIIPVDGLPGDALGESAYPPIRGKGQPAPGRLLGVGVDLATGQLLKGTWLNKKIAQGTPTPTIKVDACSCRNWDGFMNWRPPVTSCSAWLISAWSGAR